MSSVAAACVEPAAAEEKKPLKPCCACPETKKARDACIIEKDIIGLGCEDELDCGWVRGLLFILLAHSTVGGTERRGVAGEIVEIKDRGGAREMKRLTE
ncbi:hypothetical protein AMELA_G00093550 [Ameiurus melas]|uniref:Uncharacterized protein n=1 Tax=Ameiurus melas TaxID=219545 RepID=A0A7J6AX36_AMEME|nr:hypothetical protein AMELA_G00093550 [Ameiurus melas]